ncbi:hypothetical protein U9M48_011573 [Paspalum notatum var. saurae]|uniref:Uncharacterized protein n=1 Tax=Paspalum notatum var. saurae TaxID=547442 RepID=A0AAQ3SXS5_PASNO
MEPPNHTISPRRMKSSFYQKKTEMIQYQLSQYNDSKLSRGVGRRQLCDRQISKGSRRICRASIRRRANAAAGEGAAAGGDNTAVSHGDGGRLVTHYLQRERRRQLAVLRLQGLQGLRDRWPLRLVALRAPEPHDEGALHLPLAVGAGVSPQPRVRRVQDGSLPAQALHPPQQREGRVQPGHWRPAGDDLEQDDAEAVDVGLGAPAVRVHKLRVDVAHGALDEIRRLRAGAMVAEAGEPEVSKLGVEGRIEHDVARLDVTVHNALIPVLKSELSVLPLGPSQQSLGAMDVFVQAAFRHELVDEQESSSAITPAQQLHKVAMPETADDPHLRLELFPALRRLRRQLLDGHLLAAGVVAGEMTLVHAAEPSSPQHVVFREVAGCGGELTVEETSWPGHASLQQFSLAAVCLLVAAVVIVPCALLPHQPQEETHSCTTDQKDRCYDRN